jgi:hypothetical protein
MTIVKHKLFRWTSFGRRPKYSVSFLKERFLETQTLLRGQRSDLLKNADS